MPAPYRDAGAATAAAWRALARAAASRLAFLEAELSTGHTMLNAADTTRRADVRARRVALAHEAYDEVARHLVAGADRDLTARERAEVRAGLDHLRARLDRA